MSGVNEYARQNKVDVEDTWNLIAENKLIDKHFAPQYIWLMHLHKFHKGTVTLYPFSDIKKFTNTHKGKWNNKKHGEKLPLAQIENFVDKDLLILLMTLFCSLKSCLGSIEDFCFFASSNIFDAVS